jgi:hypothetical protein
MTPECLTDFDDWLVESFAESGSFTMLIVLMEINETTVEPVSSSYLHIIGDDPRWSDMVAMFAQSGVEWNAAALFRADRDGLIDDSTAQWRLSSLTRHLRKDRSLVEHGEFFNHQGLRLKLEPVQPH